LFSTTRVTFGELPAVHVDLAPDVRRALEDHEDALVLRLLDDLHLIRSGHHPRAARRKAVAFGIVFGFVLGVVVVDRGRPRHPRHPRFGLRSASPATATTATRAATARAAGARSVLRLLDRGQQLAIVANDTHRHVGDVWNSPYTFLTGDAAEVYCSVW
jgi:hypothetical protein